MDIEHPSIAYAYAYHLYPGENMQIHLSLWIYKSMLKLKEEPIFNRA